MTGGRPSGADVVVLVGNPRAGSRTRAVAEAVARALLARTGDSADSVEVLELADIVGVSFGPEPAYGATAGPDPFETVRSARLLVVATPAYKGSYTGLLKVFLDQLEHRQLADVTAVPVAVAASPTHADAAAAALRDLLVELGAQVPAPPLAVRESQLAQADEVAANWADQHAHAFTLHPIART
ncbi:NAD(P)H-dependent oxidoreductase [Micromonospora parathelypteridis]|uniref:FMN reductase n=1 Tax=Micromonospora parathelypteridis TaxID=1839617 RepID=A0A840VH16_9ACTN|nr:NAD(P)H-dependent oxidoreductase [Micromonospora parathelypteridis]MBB5476103.1 FMN reductase [Micromonospora parathelypteridis]GGO32728.1 FMN reductase [Micromonospora parathelypteridis]